MSPPRIHITGASSSGTTTLGAALAHHLGCPHHDTDRFYWQETDPPFTAPRPVGDRLGRLVPELEASERWVLSGSLMGWGDGVAPRFTLAVFLYVPPSVRLERLQARERSRYGDRIAPGGDMAQLNREFMEWASRYDDPAFEGRSLARHRAWLARLPCPVLEIAGTPSVEDSLRLVRSALENV